MDQLTIANLALRRLAVGKKIGAMNEATEPARVLTDLYATTRDEVLRAFDWPFAQKFLSLTNVAGPSPRASVDFLYSYRYPADCVYARRLRNQPRRPDVRAARVPFVIGQDGTGKLLFTDVEPIDATTDFPAFPELEYTAAVDESLWTADFSTALSQLLAWYASPSLTGGDPHKLGQRAFTEYDRTIRQAWQNNLNEREEDTDDPECAFLDARS